MNKEKKNYTRQLVALAMFAAFAYVVGAFTGIIKVAFLSFDAKDAIITLAAFMYGPISGVVISFLTALLESLTISGTGIYGFIMDFASSACFSFTAGMVYKIKRTPLGAIIAFASASLSMVLMMLLLNCFVTPLYMGAPGAYLQTQRMVFSMLPTLILPFNIAKALLNTAIAMLIYKPLTVAMRKARLLHGVGKMEFNRSSLIMLISALVTLALGVVILVLLKAQIAI